MLHHFMGLALKGLLSLKDLSANPSKWSNTSISECEETNEPTFPRRIQNPIKHPRWTISRKWLSAKIR